MANTKEQEFMLICKHSSYDKLHDLTTKLGEYHAIKEINKYVSWRRIWSNYYLITPIGSEWTHESLLEYFNKTGESFILIDITDRSQIGYANKDYWKWIKKHKGNLTKLIKKASRKNKIDALNKFGIAHISMIK